jgi:hypothetical protein
MVPTHSLAIHGPKSKSEGPITDRLSRRARVLRASASGARRRAQSQLSAAAELWYPAEPRGAMERRESLRHLVATACRWAELAARCEARLASLTAAELAAPPARPAVQLPLPGVPDEIPCESAAPVKRGAR